MNKTISLLEQDKKLRIEKSANIHLKVIKMIVTLAGYLFLQKNNLKARYINFNFSLF